MWEFKRHLQKCDAETDIEEQKKRLEQVFLKVVPEIKQDVAGHDLYVQQIVFFVRDDGDVVSCMHLIRFDFVCANEEPRDGRNLQSLSIDIIRCNHELVRS